jgi:uncharacterized protein
MAASYLHGVETIELTNGTITVSVVKSAVIGLVGISPKGDTQKLVLVNNPTQAAQFGSPLTGLNIPQALNAIFAQGAGTVLVVNIWDETAMATAVTAEAVVVANRKATTAFNPVGAAAPVVTNSGATVTYVAGTDYTINDYGVITILNTAIAEGATLKVTYKKLNGAGVTASLIIGGIDGTSEARTGFSCFVDAYNTFGFKPKIFISPGYSSLNTVAAAMISVADLYKGIAYLDAPAGTTVTAAIAGRGPLGTINFNTSSKRAKLHFPMLKAYDAATDSIINTPYSQWAAGVRAAVDNNEGYWVSSSNHEIKGILGTERPISAAINDATTDANLLNEKGITTIFNSFGTGLRLWGNRSAAFPTSGAPSNFECVQRTMDIMHESIELAMLAYVDKPIIQATIDSVRASVNAFIRTLISRGALVDGECTYDPALNSTTELAAGHIIFSIDAMPPPAMERITFNSFIDINLLKSLS